LLPEGALLDAAALVQAKLIPTNLASLNTDKDEDDPHIAGRNLRLYYTSNKTGKAQIQVSSRTAPTANWPPGVPVQGADPETENCSPCLTADEHDLYFATRILIRAEKTKKTEALPFDIVHSIRLTRPSEFTGPTPVQAICTEVAEKYPWVTTDGQELYFNRKTKEGWRLFVAPRPKGKGAFGEPRLVKEIPAGYLHPSVSSDKRTLYLQGPLEKERWGLFRCVRAIAQANWSAPEALDDLNSPEGARGDTSPCVSRDNSRLYFASDRPGGKGGKDIWIINDPWRIRGKQ
jgi:hypothetical protein